MSNLEIRESAESTSRSLINVVYYLNLVISIIAIIGGVVTILDNEYVGLYIIIAATIYIFWIILLKSLFDTFVNISVKLDRKKDIIRELQRVVSLLEKMNSTKNENKEPTSVIVKKNNPIQPDRVKIDKNKLEEISSELNIDLDNEILGEIIAGNEINARLMLMQKKGLSLDAAITYINKIKNDIK